jgi:hypothetical protein
MKHKCQTLFFLGMGQKRRCNRPVTHIFDKGHPNQTYICSECAERRAPNRIELVTADVTNPGRSTFDA